MSSSWATAVGIALAPEGDVPLGVQLDWGIRAAVAAGRLRPGEQLPGLRDVAAELGVNHNTVRAAVAKLEADGVLVTRHGAGTFVRGAAEGAAPARAALVEDVARLAEGAGVMPRELAAALWVSPPATATGDREAAERRALREELAVLDRIVGELETRLPRPLPGTAAAAAGRGPRLLSADELRAERDALVRRLADLQRTLDAATGAPAVGPGRGAATRSPSKPRRRAARRGPATA